MPTSRLDLAYGRQGGRVVPWRTDDRFRVGQVVRARASSTPGALFAAPFAPDRDVTITELLPGGRARVSYPGSDPAIPVDLVVPTSMLYPPGAHTRGSDPDTSHAAAAGLSDQRLTDGQRAALKHLALAGDAGLTDFELALRTGWAQTSIGKRRGEITAAGLVVRTRDRRLNERNQWCAVWRITPTGLAVWRATNGAA